MQKCATAPKWIFHRPANAGLLRGMQLGRISQTSTSSCWLAGTDQSTEDNHGSKNAPQTTSKNCSRLRCAPALCNSHTFHISIPIRGGERSRVRCKSYDFFVVVVTFLHPENHKSVHHPPPPPLPILQNLKICSMPWSRALRDVQHDTFISSNHLKIMFSPRHDSEKFSLISRNCEMKLLQHANNYLQTRDSLRRKTQSQRKLHTHCKSRFDVLKVSREDLCNNFINMFTPW